MNRKTSLDIRLLINLMVTGVTLIMVRELWEAIHLVDVELERTILWVRVQKLGGLCSQEPIHLIDMELERTIFQVTLLNLGDLCSLHQK